MCGQYGEYLSKAKTTEAEVLRCVNEVFGTYIYK